jgi:hypothetical protein
MLGAGELLASKLAGKSGDFAARCQKYKINSKI